MKKIMNRLIKINRMRGINIKIVTSINQILMVFFVSFLISGCSIPITQKAYDGPDKMDNEVATVDVIGRTEFFVPLPGKLSGYHKPHIDSIDGKKVSGSFTNISKVQILPGRHTYNLFMMLQDQPSGPNSFGGDVSFNAEAGKSYIIRIVAKKGGSYVINVYEKGGKGVEFQ